MGFHPHLSIGGESFSNFFRYIGHSADLSVPGIPETLTSGLSVHRHDVNWKLARYQNPSPPHSSWQRRRREGFHCIFRYTHMCRRSVLAEWKRLDGSVDVDGSKSRNKVSVGEPAEGSLVKRRMAAWKWTCVSILFIAWWKKDPIYLRRDRAKNILYHGKKVAWNRIIYGYVLFRVSFVLPEWDSMTLPCCN